MSKTIRLPQNFVFKDKSLDATIRVLVNLSKAKSKEIYIDFSNVKNSRKGDIMILMAQIEKLFLKKRKIRFKGPIDKNIKPLFSEKVFHEKIFNQDILNNYNAKKHNKIQPLIVANIVDDLSKIGINKNSLYGHLFCERIEALITEIIGNAVEHGIKKKNINYWLASDINKKTKQMHITFVDMGQGIAHSHKKSKLPWMYRIIGFFDDKKIVYDSIYGKLRSSTQKPNRGKGLPEIREIVEKELVSNFILITNRTLIQYMNNKFITKRVLNFRGTYYSLTINKQNFEKWKNM